MKPYFQPANLPTAVDLTNWNAQLQQLLQLMQPYKFTLTKEERRGKRKMGPRRVAYALAAERLGTQHENVMPRQYNAADFTAVMAFHTGLNTLLSRVLQLKELADDTLMAAGIDAMTYTKVVHDGLRSANNLDPSFDAALQELDDFNARAQAEDAEETVNEEGTV